MWLALTAAATALLIAAVSAGGLRLLRGRVARLSPRWRAALAAIAWAVEFVVLLIALTVAASPLLVGVDLAPESLGGRIVLEAAQLLPLLAAWAVVAWAWGVPRPATLGLQWTGPARGRIWRDLALGGILGPVAVGVFLLAGLVGGWDQVVGVAAPGPLLADLAGGVVLFALVALFEELSARGCLFALGARVFGIPAGVVLSAGIFGLLHIANPGATWAALGGVALAGLVFVFAFLRSGLLWLPLAFHWSWDWAETSLYGFPDSGTAPASALQLHIDPGAPAWATGGTFGPEASVFVVVALLLAAAVIAAYTRGRPGPQILFPAGAPERAVLPAGGIAPETPSGI